MMVARQLFKSAAAAAVVVLFYSVPLSAGDPEAGRLVYTKKCGFCHGKEGQGHPGMAKALKVEIKHLGSEAVQGKSDDEIKKVIAEGVGKMKPVKGLSPEDVDRILAFVRSIEE